MNAHQRRQLKRVAARLEARLNEIAPGWNAQNPTPEAENQAQNFAMNSPEMDRIFRRHPKTLKKFRASLKEFQNPLDRAI